MAQRDPFYAVKEKVQFSLTNLRSVIDAARVQVENGSSAIEVEPQLASARTTLSGIHVDVKDLSQTITIVEDNRARFPSIDDRELDSRRAFVSEAKTALSDSGRQIQQIATSATQSQAKQAKKKMGGKHTEQTGHSRFGSSANAEAGRAGDDFVASSRAQAQVYEVQQDEVLDDMAHALDRLQGIGNDINKELVESEHQLAALDEDLDQAKYTMDNVMKKMDKLLKTSDKGRLCCIVILVVTAIALFFGIIYG